MTEQKKVSVIRGELTYADKVIEKMIALNHPITKDVKAISRKLGALS